MTSQDGVGETIGEGVARDRGYGWGQGTGGNRGGGMGQPGHG